MQKGGESNEKHEKSTGFHDCTRYDSNALGAGNGDIRKGSRRRRDENLSGGKPDIYW